MVGNMCLINILKIETHTVVQNTSFGRHLVKKSKIKKFLNNLCLVLNCRDFYAVNEYAITL